MAEETVEAVHPTGTRSSTLSLTNSQPIGVEGAEVKNSRVDTTIIRNGKTRSIGTLVLKESLLQFSMRKETDNQRWMQNYMMLKRHGFPVPTTARWVQGSDQILVTDLTEGGAKTVFSKNEFDKINPIDAIDNFEDTKNQIIAIAQRADELNILITSDSYYFIVDKNKQAKVILGDLGIGIEPKSTLYGPKASEEIAKEFIEKLGRESLLNKLKKYLQRRA